MIFKDMRTDEDPGASLEGREEVQELSPEAFRRQEVWEVRMKTTEESENEQPVEWKRNQEDVES